MILLRRRIRREVQSCFRWYRSHGARLLVPCQHDFNRAQIATSAQHFALRALISSQYPKAVAPPVINDIVHVPYASRGKRVSDLPREPAIDRSIDVNLGALAIVEVFAPVNSARWNGRDVQRPCAALDSMCDLKCIAVRSACNQCTRNRAHHRLVAFRITENG